MADNDQIIPIELIATHIYVIRGQKVMLDSDLAELYGVQTKVLNQAVTRNKERFPKDFMFQMTGDDLEDWRSQIVTSNSSAKMGLRRKPYVFTELGVSMLSSVLRSQQAIEVNIAIMRAFVRMREMLATHKDLADKINEHDGQLAYLFEQVEKLMFQSDKPKHPIGFVPDEDIE